MTAEGAGPGPAPGQPRGLSPGTWDTLAGWRGFITSSSFSDSELSGGPTPALKP
jgi:hypothetical protein